jgi:hypothetical protein
MDSPFPNVPPSLVQALDERFPDKCAQLSDTERQVFFKAGQRHVVDFLIEQMRRQQDNILED